MGDGLYTIDDVIRMGEQTDTAVWNGDKENGAKYFRTEMDGGHQLDFKGKIIESSWEFFTGTVSVYEDGACLFSMDSRSVDNYKMECYTDSIFHNVDDMMSYLREKYAGAAFKSADEPIPYQRSDKESFQWEDASYAESLKPPVLTRMAFMDKGTKTSKEGVKYHVVTPVFACDQKVFGQDDTMPNPYLLAKYGKNGTVSHDLYLSTDLYQNLKNHVNKTGLEGTRWLGVADTVMNYATDRNSRNYMSIDLRKEAISKGKLVASAKPFDVEKHDAFVKRSVAKVRSQRALPDVPENDGVSADGLSY